MAPSAVADPLTLSNKAYFYTQKIRLSPATYQEVPPKLEIFKLIHITQVKLSNS
jgi:hypothetical protein